MKTKVILDAIYKASGNVVVRKVKNEIILFSVASGNDDTDNEPYFLNTTGQAVWKRLNGRKKLQDIVADLASKFKAPLKVVEFDVIEFVKTLMDKKFLVKIRQA